MPVAADGMPTKQFFVEMLTRDIELHDAILDLLDNCLDGVIRQKGTVDQRKSNSFYAGYSAQIFITTDRFEIRDNCGGIPRETAIKYAFKMGRSPEKDSDGLPTVGIYGIGMKRAIFKIGRFAKVLTRNSDTLYQVIIPQDWASSNDWSFPIEDISGNETLISGGTIIEVSELNQPILESWSSPDKIEYFAIRLIKMIQQCYSFIIQKGFRIEVNGVNVDPLKVTLLLSTEKAETRISPFLYTQTFDDVNVSLAVGLYAPPPSSDEIDDENELKRSSSDAGWTVLCNDRVVLYNDKSHLTGWGEAGVPQYHTQFIGIRGIVVFESNNPQKLPMTTTKRGIDTSSSIYSVVKDRMRQGLQIFTDYTNKWKGQSENERKYSAATTSVTVNQLLDSGSTTAADFSLTLRQNKGGLVYNPPLPKPKNDKPYRIIRFSRDNDEILDIAEYFYNDRNHPVTPSQIGEKCFDIILAKSKETKGQ